MAELSRQGSTHAFDWPSRKTAAWHVHTLSLFALRKAERNGQAKRSGEGARGSISTISIQLARKPKKSNPSAAARPSAAEKKGPGVSPDYDKTQHAYAQKKIKRNSQAERSGEGGFGGLSRIRHHTARPPTRRRKPSATSPMRQRSQAKRPRRAQRKEIGFILQQQPAPSQSTNNRRETCRLQDKEMPALL
jgi:hypothetical protein